MKKRFEELITGFCTGINMPSPEKMMSGAPFTIDKVVFAVEYKPEIHHNLLFVYADFGPIPKGSEAAVYHDLLRENFLDFLVKNATFSVSSATGNVVYVESFPLEKITVEDFTSTLGRLTNLAKKWRADFINTPRKTVPGANAQRPEFIRMPTAGHPPVQDNAAAP